MTMTSDADAEATGDGTSRWASPRGKFKIFRAPRVKRRRVVADDVDLSASVDKFDYSPLLENNDEADVRSHVDQMLRALNPGITETLLFSQRGPDGMSLYHVWFGANLPLFRHSHPKYGDCLYYILKGEVRLGAQTLGPGDGVFIPNGMPYKYTAGPDGVELLEYRAGGGDPTAPGMQLNEPSLEAIQRIIDESNKHHEEWMATSPQAVCNSKLLDDAS